MARNPNASDFTVDVPDLGRFIFARRKIGDVFKIRGRYNQITDGNYDEDGNVGDFIALAYVTIQTLLVDSPPGFDIDKLDPLVDEGFDVKLLAIFKELRSREGDFRQKANAVSETAGAGSSELSPALVP